jgi:DNA-binding response OmpR family regulator
VTDLEPISSAAKLKTVLVVEDEVLTRVSICEYLRECGFLVIEAANADEAIIVLSDPDLPVDVVLSDVEMTGTMDGFALAQWVRRHKPGLSIILAGTPARIADAAADLCENGPLLAKPYEPQLLLDRIKRLLAEIKPLASPNSGSIVTPLLKVL